MLRLWWSFVFSESDEERLRKAYNHDAQRDLELSTHYSSHPTGFAFDENDASSSDGHWSIGRTSDGQQILGAACWYALVDVMLRLCRGACLLLHTKALMKRYSAPPAGIVSCSCCSSQCSGRDFRMMDALALYVLMLGWSRNRMGRTRFKSVLGKCSVFAQEMAREWNGLDVRRFKCTVK